MNESKHTHHGKILPAVIDVETLLSLPYKAVESDGRLTCCGLTPLVLPMGGGERAKETPSLRYPSRVDTLLPLGWGFKSLSEEEETIGLLVGGINDMGRAAVRFNMSWETELVEDS